MSTSELWRLQEGSKFARVCVEINLDQPVVGHVWFRDHWFHVEYEGLHLLCKKCGIFGHTARSCTSNTSASMEVTNQVNADGAAAEGVASKEHVGGEVNPSIDDEDSIPKDQYGD